MYLQFFELNEAPFSITPDPAFVYLSAAHRDALAHLLYGVGKGGAGGFVQLTGEVGTGKTTICRCLLQQVPEDCIIALILNPILTPRELLVTICEELGIDVRELPDGSKALVDALNACLLVHHAQGRRVVVVIDEAQSLSPEALEQVRLLTNLETDKHKLLQMVLLGQPELRPLLQRQNLRQLAQRITARYHLTPLSEQETFAYVRHRMQVAGARQNPFKRSALRALYQRSGGVPRLINIIADRALAGAFAQEANTVNARLVHAAANEVQPSETRVRRNPWPGLIATAAALLLAFISIYMWDKPWLGRAGPPAAASAELPNPATETATVYPGNHETLTGDGPVVQTGNSPPGGDPQALSRLRDEPAVTEATPAAITGTNAALPEVSDLQASAKAAAEPLLPAWLDEQHERSWWGLANLWQDDAGGQSMQAACEGEVGTGYACLRDQGSWARVERLGLPVILVLHDRGERHVLLRGLDEQRVLLGVGDAPLPVDRGLVEPLWLGEYIVAWPQDPDWPLEIRRGESGAALDIVMKMARAVDPPWTGGDVFDAAFESWLIAFQRQHGLTADGIIGPKTLLYLMAPSITEPRLSAGAAAGR